MSAFFSMMSSCWKHDGKDDEQFFDSPIVSTEQFLKNIHDVNVTSIASKIKTVCMTNQERNLWMLIFVKVWFNWQLEVKRLLLFENNDHIRPNAEYSRELINIVFCIFNNSERKTFPNWNLRHCGENESCLTMTKEFFLWVQLMSWLTFENMVMLTFTGRKLRYSSKAGLPLRQKDFEDFEVEFLLSNMQQNCLRMWLKI